MIPQQKILRILQLICELSNTNGLDINELSEMINSSVRTVYRYLKLLEELGYDLQLENGNYRINTGEYFSLKFMPSESQKLIQFAEDNLELSDNKRKRIIEKIRNNTDINRFGMSLAHHKQAKIVREIHRALRENKRILFYTKENLSDPIITEVIGFEHLETIKYLAIHSENIKTESISIKDLHSIEISDENTTHIKGKVTRVFDPFYQIGSHPIHIQLILDKLTSLELHEKYPLAGKYLIKRGRNSYDLDTHVNDFFAVIRFIAGNLTGVKIIFPSRLKEEVSNYFRDNISNI